MGGGGQGVHVDRELILDMLVAWWRNESQWTPVEGYPPECPSTRGYRASRQYDSLNGAEDTDLRGRELARIGQVVATLDEPWRTALYEVARNKACQTWVWKSPRLPDDEEERAMVVWEAMEMFAARI